jgi:hypothetical protein
MRFIGLIAALAAIASIAAASGNTKQAAQPDVAVTHWSQIASAQLTTAAAGGTSVVPMAIVHGAIYDAVNAIDGGHEPYLGSPAALATDSLDAAVAAAAYNVLRNLPAPAATLAADYAASLAAIPDGAGKSGGIAVGETAAASMLAARANDGRAGLYRFPAPANPGIGQWRPELPAFVSDPNAWLKNVTPFVIAAPTKYGTGGPNAVTTKKYAAEFNEVKALGRKTDSTRTEAQTDIANFWAVNPAKLWSAIARTLVTQEQLSTVDAARFYALAFISAADALISVWNDKALWSSWRPITAIREAANDGNPATSADADWLPYLATPPYPDQPSGHTCVATAITMTAQRFFDTDKIAFSATNQVLYVPGTVTPNTSPALTATRDFTSLSQARDEVVEARILQGIHFRTADEGGVEIAKSVTNWVAAHALKNVGNN